MAEIGFSQSAYTVIEGGEEISVCVVLVSLTGQVNEEAFVGINTLQGSALSFSVSGAVDFTGVEVNDPILCAPVLIAADNILAGPRLSLVSAFVEGPLSITFTPGGEEATIETVETTGMLPLTTLYV